MSRKEIIACIVALVAGATATPVAAQVKASERAAVMQTVDGTDITVNYARPHVRGRDSLFTKVVRVGQTWTPGANEATTLEVSRAVKIDGHDVPPGKYSVWMIIQPAQWTVVLDPKFNRFHTEPPDSTANQIRWQVTPQDDANTELLTWSFPEVRPDGALLSLAWGPRRVLMNFTVTPKSP
jgi:hypothetical protein